MTFVKDARGRRAHRPRPRPRLPARAAPVTITGVIRTIDRYIMRELFWPYIFGMLGFLVVIAIDPMISAMKNVINKQIDIAVVVKWFLFSLTHDMIFTFPMAMLLSSLLLFGRLSKDSEIVAMKAGGIGFGRLVMPVVFFAFLSTVAAFLFGEFVMPYTTSRARDIQKNDILKLLPVRGAENVYIKDTDQRTIYAGKVIHFPGEEVAVRLEDVVISEYDPKTQLPLRRILAKGGAFMNKQWNFWDGMAYEYDRELNGVLVEEFKSKPIALKERPDDFKKEETRFGEMSLRDLRKRISYHYEKGFHDVVGLLVEFYMKTSIPFACFIFGILGAALGTGNSKTGAFIGFGVSVIIIFIYYVLLSISKSYGKNGVIPPLLAAWLQNLVFLAVALYAVHKVRD